MDPTMVRESYSLKAGADLVTEFSTANSFTCSMHVHERRPSVSPYTTSNAGPSLHRIPRPLDYRAFI